MDDWPDRQELMAGLTQWLDDTCAEAGSLDDAAFENARVEDTELASGYRPYETVAQMTALRHEIKLLTKTSRAGEDRNESIILSMQAAIDEFRGVASKELQAADQAVRPFVESLIDLDESLVRIREAIENARQRFGHDCQDELGAYQSQFDELFATQSWWRRLLCRPWYRAIRQFALGETWKSQRAVFDSMLEGLALVTNRLRRAMDEQLIVRMRCVGRVVDPNTMTVIEVVSDASLPPNTVCEELRTGYYWQGKVFRFAEVKAVGRI